MIKCQMNNTNNTSNTSNNNNISAPNSPIGTTPEKPLSQPRLSRSKSFSDMSHADPILASDLIKSNLHSNDATTDNNRHNHDNTINAEVTLKSTTNTTTPAPTTIITIPANLTASSTTTTPATNNNSTITTATPTNVTTYVINTKSSRSKSKDNNNNSNSNNTITNNNNSNNNSIINNGSLNLLADGKSLIQQPQQRPLLATTFASGRPLNTAATITTSAEAKPKSSRSRKSTATNNNNNNKGANVINSTPKPETKRAKSKSAKAAAADITLPPAAPSTATNDKAPIESTQPQAPTVTKKRKSRSTSNDSSNNPTVPSTTTKRQRKKKSDQGAKSTDNSSLISNSITTPLNVANPQLLSVASNVPMVHSPSINSAPPPPHLPNVNNRLLPGLSPLDSQDANRYFSLTISPYANYDYTNAASLTRPSLSRLFTSSSSAENVRGNSYSDELTKAFEELRDNTWNHLSRCILEQAQQFDIPSLIGTLYTLRSENEKLVNKVRDLTMKRNDLLLENARLEFSGPMLTQHLSHTSPNFSSVVSGLTNSPKSLPNSSPSPAMNKSPLVSGGSYNHVPPGGSLGPPSFLDRNSPLVSVQTSHSGVNNLKSSSISTPSPPIGALMAHGANNRASLMTVNNPPYMSSVHQTMNALNPLGPNSQSSSYYTRQ